jgi:hypothetical protein
MKQHRIYRIGKLLLAFIILAGFYVQEPTTAYTQGLMISGEIQKEETGKLIEFDDSKEHFAVNLSSEDRAILYIKFTNDDSIDFSKVSQI